MASLVAVPVLALGAVAGGDGWTVAGDTIFGVLLVLLCRASTLHNASWQDVGAGVFACSITVRFTGRDSEEAGGQGESGGGFQG